MASMRRVNNIAVVINGISIRLFFKPGIDKVRRVTIKLVNDIVVLIPAKTTDNMRISCAPIPVNFTLEEKGVIKVQPAAVSVRFEHFVKYTFRRLAFTTLLAAYQNDSGYSNINFQNKSLNGTNEYTL